MKSTLAVTGESAFDQIVQTNPLALLLGLLLDQQISIELAFRGPQRLADRLSGELTASHIATLPLDELVAAFSEKPALHRFPKSMGERAAKLCAFIVDTYAGDASRLWTDQPDAQTLAQRVGDLPGFGDEKTMILMAVFGKRTDIAPNGWEHHAGPFADEQPRSVADIDSPSALQAVKDWKKRQRAAGLTKQQ